MISKDRIVHILNSGMTMQKLYDMCNLYAMELNKDEKGSDKTFTPEMFNLINNHVDVDPRTGMVRNGHQLILDVFNGAISYFRNKFAIVELRRGSQILKYY